MKANFTPFLLAVFSLFIITSCSKSLSDQHVKYLGQWGSNKHSLEIWKNGTATYQKKNQDPIDCWVEIKNNRIKFKGIKTFHIDNDPYVNQEGFTVMILDNRVFYKH